MPRRTSCSRGRVEETCCRAPSLEARPKCTRQQRGRARRARRAHTWGTPLARRLASNLSARSLLGRAIAGSRRVSASPDAAVGSQLRRFVQQRSGASHTSSTGLPSQSRRASALPHRAVEACSSGRSCVRALAARPQQGGHHAALSHTRSLMRPNQLGTSGPRRHPGMGPTSKDEPGGEEFAKERLVTAEVTPEDQSGRHVLV